MTCSSKEVDSDKCKCDYTKEILVDIPLVGTAATAATDATCKECTDGYKPGKC